MKRYVSYIALIFTPLLFGCGSSLPNCSDKEVISLLKQISKKHDIELISVSGITTKNRSDNECKCTGLGKFRSDGEEEELNINYIINLADNKKEFTVELRLD